MRIASPLKVCLLAACAVHLLGLSAWQLQRSRQRPVQQLVAADDTPLLLQFSREDPTPPDPLSIQLPSAMLLPPSGPLPSEASSNPAKPAAGATRARAPSSRPAQRAVAASGAVHNSVRRASAAGSATPDRYAAPSLASGSPLRLALEAALKEAAGSSPAAEGRGSGANSGSPGSGSGGPGQPGAGQGQPSAETAAERRLWSLATPTPLPEGGDDSLKGLELRRLPLDVARSNGAQPIQGSSLRSDDRLVVLWIQGRTLWLFSLPLPAQSGAPSASRPPEPRPGT